MLNDTKRISIAVVYQSGVGNTRKVATKIYERLSEHCEAALFSVEEIPDGFNLNDYNGVILGFPVIHSHPAKRILNFLSNLEPLANPKPAYIYTTCGLYSANSLRIFAKRCIRKNIIPINHRVFWGCPAADGTLLAPVIKWFYRFPKDLDENIAKDIDTYCYGVENGVVMPNIPRFKLYSILNYPNKLAGQVITFPIYLHKHKCSRCGKCITDCAAAAIDKDHENYPVFISRKCEKCYRCIHHCPNLALSLSKWKSPKQVLDSFRT